MNNQMNSEQEVYHPENYEIELSPSTLIVVEFGWSKTEAFPQVEASQELEAFVISAKYFEAGVCIFECSDRGAGEYGADDYAINKAIGEKLARICEAYYS